jgi:hypothetical protein
MRTRATQSRKRRWRTAGLALTGAAALLLAGTLGAGPALATTQNCHLKVVIVGQPTTTQAGSPVAPPVVVNVENSDGKVDWNYNGWVTLSYAVNPDGAAAPAGNVVQAVHGVATFSQLTFGSVGFGFELAASIPGATSQPSQPFDIVGQLVVCQAGQPCQSGTVRSDGTSGFARAGGAASSGILTATGGGFPSLSCGTLGGVLTFSSTRQLIITISLAASIVRSSGHHGVSSFNACWGAPQPFRTKNGRTSAFNPANDEFEGLLPACGWGWHRAAPCVLSRYRTWTGAVVITVLAPAGDPRIMGA